MHFDISFAVGLLSRYLSQPKKLHLNAARHILRYLKGTNSFGMIFQYGNNMSLQGFTDADWAGDLDKRRSTTGYVFFLAGSPISC
jgi:hypothetical protein